MIPKLAAMTLAAVTSTAALATPALAHEGDCYPSAVRYQPNGGRVYREGWRRDGWREGRGEGWREGRRDGWREGRREGVVRYERARRGRYGW